MTMPLIRSESFGLDEQVHDLLVKSMIRMSTRQVDAWMEFQYDPSHMFVMIRNGLVVSCLQTEARILNMDGHKMQVSVPILFCTHPDYRLQKCFGRLLDAAIQVSACNDLAMLAASDQVKVLEKRSFQRAARSREYFISADKLEGYSGQGVSLWQREDLYPLYCEFLENFPVKVQLDREAFVRRLQYARASGRKVWVAHDREGMPEAFGISSQSKDQIRFETVVYENGQALASLLKRQVRFADTICVQTGPNEALERLFGNCPCKRQMPLLVRLSSWKLASKALGSEVHNGLEMFEQFPMAMWMQLL